MHPVAVPKCDSTSVLHIRSRCPQFHVWCICPNVFVQIVKCICSKCKICLFCTMHLPKMFFNKRVLSPSPHHIPLPPLWFTLDIHQNTHLKPSYLFKDPVTKDKSKVICIFRVQISNRTHFTSKYVCFPSHRESLVATMRGQTWKILWSSVQEPVTVVLPTLCVCVGNDALTCSGSHGQVQREDI